LEAALLREFHHLYSFKGFPDPASIFIAGRSNTGAGRYVELRTLAAPMPDSGYLDLGGKFIEMEGVSTGMMAVILVRDGKPVEIEIAVYGNAPWDGEEREWSITDGAA
jgi:hypothetical protein